MSTATLGYHLPSALRLGEHAARRVLRLEHGANALPIGHILCYLGLFAFALLSPVSTVPLVAVPTFTLLLLLSYSITIGVLHMHAHRPLFVGAGANRVLDVLCCVPSWLSAAEMRTVHVVNHHRFDDGPGDVTSTMTYERGLRALWYWLRYAYIVRRATVRSLFAEGVSVQRRLRRRTFVIDLSLVLTAMSVLTVAFPMRMLVFYWVPFLLTHLTSGYFAWLTHAPARAFEGGSASINTVGNVLNFFIFNQGYHSVHHRYPGIHWTEIPDKLDYMLEIEPEVIVPYWVTLHSAWRIVAPDRFRNAPFGTRWQARLGRRLAEGSARSRRLPWFAWI
jgi:fatty acid desaturase